MLTDMEKSDLLVECGRTIGAFLERMREIERQYNVYVVLDSEDVEITSCGELFVRYMHSIRVRQILVQ